MRALIIEDDEGKLADMRSFLESLDPEMEIYTAKSLHTGKEAALGQEVDFILLDMTMRNFERSPTEEGGRPHAFAGREILRQMHRGGVATPVIVVTQFDRFGNEEDSMTLADLRRELSGRFANYRGIVYYRSNVDTWRDTLASHFHQIRSEVKE